MLHNMNLFLTGLLAAAISNSVLAVVLYTPPDLMHHRGVLWASCCLALILAAALLSRYVSRFMCGLLAGSLLGGVLDWSVSGFAVHNYFLVSYYGFNLDDVVMVIAWVFILCQITITIVHREVEKIRYEKS